jgi:UPF0755 protein
VTHRPLGHDLFGGALEQPPDEPPRELRRRDLHAKPPARRGRRWLVLLLTAAVVLVVGTLAWSSISPLISTITSLGHSDPTDYPGPGTGQVTVVVKQGDTGGDIATTLKAAGVVLTRTAYLDAARANPETSAAIQPGTYLLRSQMTGAEAFAMLSDPANRQGGGVTVREGLWKSEIFDLLAKQTGTPLADYVAAAKDTKALGLPAAAKGNLEGYLFPATYDFPEGLSAAAQLKAMVAKAVEQFTAAGLTPATMERTVIVASIVEAEARGEADRAKVARVIENRVKNTGAPNYGLLQLDSTVSYGAKHRSVTTTDAERADPNPWNTYVRKGLPVGPIGNPGLKAIDAALHPTPGPWLFFVAVNPVTGETKFATTQAEHDKDVAQFQAFCRAHPGTC